MSTANGLDESKRGKQEKRLHLHYLLFMLVKAFRAQEDNGRIINGIFEWIKQYEPELWNDAWAGKNWAEQEKS